MEGALGYRYKLGRKLVSNETYEEENSCFNPEPVPEQVFISCYFLKSLFTKYVLKESFLQNDVSVWAPCFNINIFCSL